MGWADLHGGACRTPDVVRARLRAIALIDMTLGLGAWHPGPVAGRAPDFLDGQRDVVCYGSRTNAALAAITASLDKRHNIEGHRRLSSGAARSGPMGVLRRGIALLTIA